MSLQKSVSFGPFRPTLPSWSFHITLIPGLQVPQSDAVPPESGSSASLTAAPGLSRESFPRISSCLGSCWFFPLIQGPHSSSSWGCTVIQDDFPRSPVSSGSGSHPRDFLSSLNMPLQFSSPGCLPSLPF